jgi:DNA-directed RNA polymerase specialized sigma24 family protein
MGLADEDGIDARETQDEALLDALRLALRRAFDSISATDKVLLQLVHGHKVDQRILAKILGWSDTKMSRHLSALRSDLKAQVELFLINSQSGMAPRWKDIVEVCGRMVEPL